MQTVKNSDQVIVDCTTAVVGKEIFDTITAPSIDLCFKSLEQLKKMQVENENKTRFQRAKVIQFQILQVAKQGRVIGGQPEIASCLVVHWEGYILGRKA